MMRSERVKLISKEGFNFSKPIGLVEIYFDDGSTMKIEDAITELLQLRTDLSSLENELKELTLSVNSRIKRIEKIQNLEDEIVLE